MREETRAALVLLPAGALWDYLADYDRVVRLGWADASARRIRPTRRCPTRYRATTTWEGIRKDYTACLGQATRPETLTWSTRDGAARSWVRFDLARVDAASTRVSVTLHFEVVWSIRTHEALAWDLLKPAFVATIAGLESMRSVAPGAGE